MSYREGFVSSLMSIVSQINKAHQEKDEKLHNELMVTFWNMEEVAEERGIELPEDNELLSPDFDWDEFRMEG